MIIRYATPDDAETLFQIEAASYPKAEGASLESIQKRIGTFPEHFWLLELGDEVAAFINGLVTDYSSLTDEMYNNPGMHNESGSWQMIFSVVTSPKCRGCGFAGELMNRVIQDAKTQKRLGIVLTCKEHMLGFYSRFGFENEGVSQSEHGGVQWYQMRLTF